MSPSVVRATAVAGYLMALMFGVHAVAFRAVPGFAAGALQPVPFAAEKPVEFFFWILPAMAVWVLLVAILPAVWVGLGRGWLPGSACLLLFGTAVSDIAADGAALSYYALSNAYLAAEDAGRVGLLAATDAVQATVVALVNLGVLLFLLGGMGLAVASARRRTAVPRWYGFLFLAGFLVNGPIAAGPPIVWGALNVVVFGGFVFLTVSAMQPRAATQLGAEKIPHLA